MHHIIQIFPHHYDDFKNHLKRLPPWDKYLRFGYPIADYQIDNYIENLDKNKDLIYGVYDEKLNLIGAIHCAFSDHTMEIGISVDPDHRKKGIGSKLFGHAIIAGRNRGCKKIVTFCLTENSWMMNHAKKIGMKINRESGDAHAQIDVLPGHVLTWIEELRENNLGFWEYYKNYLNGSLCTQAP